MLHKQLVLIFAILVLIYIVINKQSINKLDTLLLLVSVVALTWKALSNGNALEGFSNSKVTEGISLEEDFSKISENLQLYFTSFNKLSYTQGSRLWRNIMETEKTQDGIICKTNLVFDSIPNYSSKDGFGLDTNGITGPLSNTLKVKASKPYTLAMTFKTGNLKQSIGKNGVIEILKLYANSPNNNALSIYIPEGTIKVQNNAQFGKLMLHYTDTKPIECKLSALDNLFNLDDNTLTFLFFVRHEGYARLLYMTDKSKTVNQIARFDIPNSDTTFSNKEMSINRFKNWNARIINFAVYDTAFTDGNASLFYDHVLSLFIKFNDPYYMETVNQYNKATSEIKKLMECPFNESICKKCSLVTQWNDLSQVVTAPLECRKEILKFCTKNPSHPFCKCWDTKNAVSEQNSCKGLRQIFATDDPIFSCNNMSKDDLKCVSNKYNLKPVKKASIASVISPNEGYTFDKIRVQYPEGTGLTSLERSQNQIPNRTPSTMRMNDYQLGNTGQLEIETDTSKLLQDVQTSMKRDEGFWTKFLSMFRS
jgi:hypothetical protein